MSNFISHARPDLIQWWDTHRNPEKWSPGNVTIGSSKRVWWTDPEDPQHSELLRVKDMTRRSHPRKYIASHRQSSPPTTQEITGAPGAGGQLASGRRSQDPEGMLGVTNVPNEPEISAVFETDGKDSATLEVRNVAGPPTDDLFTEVLERAGIDPEKYEIVDTLRISDWQQHPGGPSLYAYKYKLAPRGLGIDLDGAVNVARKGAKKALAAGKKQTSTDVVRTLQVSDLQIGKVENGGLTQHDLITRFFEGLGHFAETVEPGQPVHVIFAGDCLEGNQSQNGKNNGFRTPLHINEQLRLYHRLLTETIVELAAVTPDLTISVVGGNHDDTDRRLGAKAGSNWATEVAILVDGSIRTFSDAYDHVRILVPQEDKSWMTVDVAGTVWTIAHGHQWRRGKAGEWWSSMCYYSDNAAGAHILAHGHEHTFYFRQEGSRHIVCSPTMDGGSDWFSQRTGAWQTPHGVAYDAVKGSISNLSLI